MYRNEEKAESPRCYWGQLFLETGWALCKEECVMFPAQRRQNECCASSSSSLEVGRMLRSHVKAIGLVWWGLFVPRVLSVFNKEQLLQQCDRAHAG